MTHGQQVEKKKYRQEKENTNMKIKMLQWPPENKKEIELEEKGAVVHVST